MDGEGCKRVATQAAAARASGGVERAGAGARPKQSQSERPPHDTDRWCDGRGREKDDKKKSRDKIMGQQERALKVRGARDLKNGDINELFISRHSHYTERSFLLVPIFVRRLFSS